MQTCVKLSKNKSKIFFFKRREAIVTQSSGKCLGQHNSPLARACTVEASNLQPMGQIWPSNCFCRACKLRMGFTFSRDTTTKIKDAHLRGRLLSVCLSAEECHACSLSFGHGDGKS